MIADGLPAAAMSEPRFRFLTGKFRWVLPLAVALATVLLDLPLARAPLSGADFNCLLKPGEYASLHWTLFRPLMAGLLVLGRMAFGLNAIPYHLVAIGLHAVCSALVCVVLVELTAWPVAIAGAGVFVLSPRSLEAVLSTSAAVNELPYALCCLLAVLLWLRRPRSALTSWSCACLYLVGLLAKQSAIVLPAILLLTEAASLQVWPSVAGWVDLARSRAKELAPLVVIGVAYGGFEVFALHIAYATPGHPAYGLVNAKEFLHYLVEYPTLAIAPFLSHAWTIRVAHEAVLLPVLVPLTVRWARAGDLRTFGLAWFWVAALPTMLFAGFAPSDEYFYVPMVGIGMIVAGELTALRGTARGIALVAATMVFAGGFVWTAAGWTADARDFRGMELQVLAATAADPTATITVAGAPAMGRHMPEFLDALPSMVQLLQPGWQGSMQEVPARSFGVTAPGRTADSKQ